MSAFKGSIPEIQTQVTKPKYVETLHPENITGFKKVKEYPSAVAARNFIKDNPEFAKKHKTLENGHWEFPEKMGAKGYVGFVYSIYDKVLNRAYLGKKLFLGTGKLNYGKESNWKQYVSSSNLLADMFKERPAEEFEFICIEQYKTKGCLSYAETWSLCFVEAPTSKIFYNTRIEGISWSVKEKISERHKERLNIILQRTQDGN